jgi:predicted acetyltransferase
MEARMSENLAKQVEVTRASISEKLILRHLMQLYNYDFTEFDGVDTDEVGLFRYDYLDHYWTEDKRHPYLVRVAGKLAGFALVKANQKDDGAPSPYMAEFFIMKKYRGRGIGQVVAFYLFDLYPGEWEVSEIAQNFPAQAFWRKIIGRYTDGQFEEEIMEDGDVLQIFRSPRTVSDTSGT